MQITFELINNGRKERGQPLERIQYEKKVSTKSGIEGYLASHGFEGEPDRGYINHYYFKSPSGRIVCICVYLSGATKDEESRLDNIILNSLAFMPTKAKMANGPMQLVTMPSALLAFRLRSRLGCQKQVGASDRGRSEKI